jgi:glutamine cyclotransferase
VRAWPDSSKATYHHQYKRFILQSSLTWQRVAHRPFGFVATPESATSKYEKQYAGLKPGLINGNMKRANRQQAEVCAMKRVANILLLTLLTGAPALWRSSSAAAGQRSADSGYSAMVPIYTAEVVGVFPHDPEAFTQGLVFNNGVLLESTGLNGFSSLRRVDLATGRVLKRIDVPNEFFAEGIAVHNGLVFQLTWTSNKAFVYDLESFNLLKEAHYEGEGWGLASDGESLIMSDGTNQLRFLDPATFQVRRTIEVFNFGAPVVNLNELEYIEGEIFANVWQTDRIARIDPASGRVLGWIDLRGLLAPGERGGHDDVLNGIAYDPRRRRLFVTGKRWPKLFEIRLRNRGDERPIRRSRSL